MNLQQLKDKASISELALIEKVEALVKKENNIKEQVIKKLNQFFEQFDIKGIDKEYIPMWKLAQIARDYIKKLQDE